MGKDTIPLGHSYQLVPVLVATTSYQLVKKHSLITRSKQQAELLRVRIGSLVACTSGKLQAKPSNKIRGKCLPCLHTKEKACVSCGFIVDSASEIWKKVGIQKSQRQSVLCSRNFPLFLRILTWILDLQYILPNFVFHSNPTAPKALTTRAYQQCIQY